MFSQDISQLINSGIARIARDQLPNGGFRSFSGSDPENLSAGIVHETIFFAANILSCLASAGRAYEPTVRRAAAFLIEQKSEPGSFNYWSRAATERQTMPYPDDLDDTFGALAALAQYDPAFIDGKVLASVAKILPAVEIQPGGPYRTWLIGPEVDPIWRDVDVVANSTTGYFLSLVDVRLPNLEKFIHQCISDDQLTSPYYPGTIQAIYFISRFYKGAENAKLANVLLDFLPANSLEHAMAITALINLGYGDRVATQRVEGFMANLDWQPYAFCIDPARDGKKYYAGSSALTAAFCIEALAKYAALSCSRELSLPMIGSIGSDGFHERIRSMAKDRCAGLQADLRSIALTQIEKTHDEKITLLAYEFRQALGGKGRAISMELIEKLALGNFYGWMAYTIYDDLLDAEGEAALISCANFFSRELSFIYAGLDMIIPGSRNLFADIMNTIDGANAWEQTYCHLPFKVKPSPVFVDYDKLADRSIGHALPVLIELLALGYGAGSKVYNDLLIFFRHYLIARQLHDDAHDWADDLARGQLNSVGDLVIAEFMESEFAGQKDRENSWADLIPRLRIFFWKRAIDRIKDMICWHIAKARFVREQCELLGNGGGELFMQGALATLEASAQRTLEERDEMLKFLAAYEV